MNTTRRITGILMGLALAAFVAVPAGAQTDAATMTGTANVELQVDVVMNTPIDWGTVFPGEGLVNFKQQGLFDVSLTPGQVIGLEFTEAPSSLSDGSGNTISLSYDLAAARANCNGSTKTWDVQTGSVSCGDSDGDGSITVELGHGGQDGRIRIDVSDTATPQGTYEGVWELTATF